MLFHICLSTNSLVFKESHLYLFQLLSCLYNMTCIEVLSCHVIEEKWRTMFRYIFINIESSIKLNNTVIIFKAFFIPFPMIACFFSIPLLTAKISLFLISIINFTFFLSLLWSTSKILQYILPYSFFSLKNTDYISHLTQNGSFGENLIKF